MPTFKYKARTLQGEPIAGSLWAPSELEALREIERLGMLPIGLVTGETPAGRAARTVGGHAKVRDLILVTRQLLTIYRSGVPLVAGLQVLQEQASSAVLAETLRLLRADVEAGATLADAMARYPAFFPELYVSVIRAGEAAGALEPLLSKLADTLETQARLRAEVKTALRYPSFVVVALVLAFIVIVTVVFPRLQPLFDRFGNDLPLPTKVLVFINNTVQNHGLAIVIVGVATALSAGLWWRTRAAQIFRDRLFLRLPAVGPIYRKVLMARFALTFGTIHRSGITLLDNLTITSRTVQHTILAAEILRIREAIIGGSTLSAAMREAKIFPPLVIHLASIGEKSGQLEEMMEFVGQHFDEEVRYDVRNLTQLIEPILTVTLACFVLGFALAVFLPYWHMLDALKR